MHGCGICWTVITDLLWKPRIFFFAFDDTAVKAENAAINKIASEYTYGLESGQLDPDIYLPEMLGKMQEAGETQVCLELSGQYQAWRTEQKERNGGKK